MIDDNIKVNWIKDVAWFWNLLKLSHSSNVRIKTCNFNETMCLLFYIIYIYIFEYLNITWSKLIFHHGPISN